MKENQLTGFGILMISFWVHLITMHYGVLKIKCVRTLYSMIRSVHHAVLCMKPSDYALKNTLKVPMYTCWQALGRVHYTSKCNNFEAMPNTLEWHISSSSAPSELKSTRRLWIEIHNSVQGLFRGKLSVPQTMDLNNVMTGANWCILIFWTRGRTLSWIGCNLLKLWHGYEHLATNCWNLPVLAECSSSLLQMARYWSLCMGAGVSILGFDRLSRSSSLKNLLTGWKSKTWWSRLAERSISSASIISIGYPPVSIGFLVIGSLNLGLDCTQLWMLSTSFLVNMHLGI